MDHLEELYGSDADLSFGLSRSAKPETDVVAAQVDPRPLLSATARFYVRPEKCYGFITCVTGNRTDA